jgi:hypothetical protein
MEHNTISYSHIFTSHCFSLVEINIETIKVNKNKFLKFNILLFRIHYIKQIANIELDKFFASLY